MQNANNVVMGNTAEWIFAPERIRPELVSSSPVNTRLAARLAQFFASNPDSKVTLMHLSRALDYDYNVQTITSELERLVRTGFLEYHHGEDFKRYSLSREARNKFGILTRPSTNREH